MSPTDASRPTGRHRADPSGSPRWRPLLAAGAVAAVVGLAAATAQVLTPPPDPAQVLTPAKGSPQATAQLPSAPPAPAASPGPTAADAAGAGVPSEAPAPPGDPIPGPEAPAVPVDGLAPTVLRVPAIDLGVPLIDLGLTPDGAIEVPSDPDDAGWLTAGAVPGRTGPAVIAGHVDSADGEAVFTRLEDLVAGDEVEVELDDGTSVGYVVTSSERYAKDAFPSAQVYGPAPASVLRLITCGGTFDRAAGSYEDNLVVYAVLAP